MNNEIRSRGLPDRPDAGEQGRAKRRRYPRREKYTPSACVNCKKRKVRCSGDMPCQRCSNFGAVCSYGAGESDPIEEKDIVTGGDREVSQDVSRQFREVNSRLAKLQDQVDFLLRQNSQFVPNSSTDPVSSSPSPQSTGPNIDPPTSSSILSQPRAVTYAGPTSTAFSFDIANSSLERMGVQPVPPESPTQSPRQSISKPGSISAKDRVLAIGEQEVVRLIKIYEDNVGMVYPCLDTDGLSRQVKRLWTFTNSTSPYIRLDDSEEYAGFDRDSEILTMVLAIALVFEGKGYSERASRLMDSAEETMFKRMNIVEVDLKELMIFTLMSIYHFECGAEVLAYRTAGLAARGALEMGLHRRDTWLRSGGSFRGELVRSWALRLFWCIYVLDREWSFVAGMPFAMRDSDIDTESLLPIESTPYLTAMVAYGRLGSKIWKFASRLEGNSCLTDTDTSKELDAQVERWAQDIPEILQSTQLGSNESGDEASQTLRLLQILLYLRKNQMRIWIYRHHLFSSSSIADGLDCAKLVIGVAKDTIRVLHRLNQTSSIYATHQTKLNFFLVSVLAVLFLAVCHAPAQFAESCQAEFHIALDLVKGFSAKSYASSRLWKTLERLKQIAPSLGLSAGPTGTTVTGIESTSEAAAPSREAAQTPRAQWLIQPGLQQEVTYTSMFTENGYQMSYELMSLFEAAGGTFVDAASTFDQSMSRQQDQGNMGGPDDLFGLEDDPRFSELMMNLF